MPISFIRGTVLCAALAACSVVACNDSSDESSRAEEGRVEDSVENAEPAATLKVVAPAGAPDARVRISTIYGKLGEEIGPLRETNVTYWWDLISYPVTTSQFTYVTPGSRNVVEAALLPIALANPPAPTVGITKLDMMPVPLVHLYRIINGVANKINKEALPLAWDGSTRLAVLPGRYQIAFGYDGADGQTVDIAAGATNVVQAWGYGGRRVAKLVAPVRQFPTASCALSTNQRVQHYLLRENSSTKFALADGASSAEFGARAEWDYRYYFTIQGIVEAGYPMQIPVPLGEAGQGALAFQVGRLDVDHVAVLQGDGTTKMVAGTYQVYRKTLVDSAGNDVFSQQNLACNTSVPTRTGLDVPRGRYKVVVTYSTVEAGQKQSVHIVDVE